MSILGVGKGQASASALLDGAVKRAVHPFQNLFELRF